MKLVAPFCGVKLRHDFKREFYENIFFFKGLIPTFFLLNKPSRIYTDLRYLILLEATFLTSSIFSSLGSVNDAVSE